MKSLAPKRLRTSQKGAKLNMCSLVRKYSARLASVAAPPPGARQGFGGANCPRHPSQVAVYTPPPPRAKISATGGFQEGVRQGPLGGGGGGVAATPLRHTHNCGKSRDRGVATPWRATGGGSVAYAQQRCGSKSSNTIRFATALRSRDTEGAKFKDELSTPAPMLDIPKSMEHKTDRGQLTKPNSNHPIYSCTGD